MTLPAFLLAVAAPTAIVDTVVGDVGVTPLQLLAPGTELVLDANARVRLAYFASCIHETARGGRLRIGVTASLAEDAAVERVEANCTPPAAFASGGPGALVLRAASTVAASPPTHRMRSHAPAFIQLGGGVLELAPLGIELMAGALYEACTRRGCVRLWIDPAATHGAGPVLERVVRVP